MEVTRDVITDLLPAYLAGEATADTRTLVEAFLKSDPEFARRVEAEWTQNLTALAAIPAPVSPDREKAALDRTKTLLKVRSRLFWTGILFVTFAAYILFGRVELPLWGAVGIAAVCFFTSALTWGISLWIGRRGASSVFDWGERHEAARKHRAGRTT